MDVSVVIAARNAAPTLACALDSVVSQTLAPREILVVDDGSTDGTAEVARGYGACRLVQQDHWGVSAARNRGVAEATGAWVAILDADDAWAPSRLERVAEVVAARGPCLVGPDAWVWRPPETMAEARTRGERVFADLCGQRLRQEPLVALFANAPVMHPVVPRDVLLAQPYDEDLTLAEDTELAWRLAAGGLPVCLLPEPLGFYRIHGGPGRHGDPLRAAQQRHTMLQRALQRCGAHPVAAPFLARDLRRERRNLAYQRWRLAVRGGDWTGALRGFSPWMLGEVLRAQVRKSRAPAAPAGTAGRQL